MCRKAVNLNLLATTGIIWDVAIKGWRWHDNDKLMIIVIDLMIVCCCAACVCAQNQSNCENSLNWQLIAPKKLIPNNLEKINLAANGQWQQKEDEKIGHGRKLKSGNPRMWKQNLKGAENGPRRIWRRENGSWKARVVVSTYSQRAHLTHCHESILTQIFGNSQIWPWTL